MVDVVANNKETFLPFAQQLLSLSHFLFSVRFYCNFTFMTYLSHFLRKNSGQIGFREQELFSFSVLRPPNGMLDALNVETLLSKNRKNRREHKVSPQFHENKREY